MNGRNLPALAAIMVFVTLFGIYVAREPLQRKVYSFLSLSRPVQAEVLVIEGWLSNRMFKEAAGIFLQGNYSYCLIIGKTRSSRSPLRVLMSFGLDSAAVKSTDAETTNGHYTYHMALAAHQWLQTHDPKASKINVFTAGPHGRKSWIIFKRVLGPDYSVGILSSSIEPDDIDLWWGSKQGKRTLIKYGIGYFYALVWPFKK